jgi:transposase
MARPSKYSPELRERAVRMVLGPCRRALVAMGNDPIGGRQAGLQTEALRRCVRQAERDSGQRPGLPTDDRERLKQLERENFELRRANEILKKASAYIAQAELDRRAK